MVDMPIGAYSIRMNKQLETMVLAEQAVHAP
jgi:hypothetical protein